MRMLAVIACSLLVAASAACAEPLVLQRGVGVHEWLNWAPINADKSYVRPPYRSEAEWLAGARPLSDWPEGGTFPAIRAAGFDFVRLSVDPGPLVENGNGERKEALAVLEQAVRRIAASDLRIVFNLQGVSQVPETGMDMIYGGADSEGVSRYRSMVQDVAKMLVGIGTDKVALEPFNEPAYYPCDASGTGDWQRIMEDTVRDIRAVSRELTIVATGACGGSVAGLVNLDPRFDDPNLLYSFHMYEPHSFTHQRSEEPDGFASGMPWPAATSTPEAVAGALEARMDAAGLGRAERRAKLAQARPAIAEYFAEGWGEKQLEERFAAAVGWARENGIPSSRLFMGEFGVILMSADGRSGAEDADRLRYVTAVRRLAERFGIAWSMWEFSNPYGMSLVLPKGPAVFDPALVEALGLRRP